MRLFSNTKNLQNIPANSIYGKLIKECFVGPKNWLFCGADFSSLEDMISALTTKDPNKIAVYTEGYDGHSLRAFAYFRDELPGIRQAEAIDRCFQLNIGNVIVNCKSGDFIIDQSGKSIAVEEYYEANKRV